LHLEEALTDYGASSIFALILAQLNRPTVTQMTLVGARHLINDTVSIASHWQGKELTISYIYLILTTVLTGRHYYPYFSDENA
jgi:hypothetical protein